MLTVTTLAQLVLIAIGAVLAGLGIGYDLRRRTEHTRTDYCPLRNWPAAVHTAFALADLAGLHSAHLRCVTHDTRTGRLTLSYADGTHEVTDAHLRPLRRTPLGWRPR